MKNEFTQDLVLDVKDKTTGKYIRRIKVKNIIDSSFRNELNRIYEKIDLLNSRIDAIEKADFIFNLLNLDNPVSIYNLFNSLAKMFSDYNEKLQVLLDHSNIRIIYKQILLLINIYNSLLSQNHLLNSFQKQYLDNLIYDVIKKFNEATRNCKISRIQEIPCNSFLDFLFDLLDFHILDEADKYQIQIEDIKDELTQTVLQ